MESKIVNYYLLCSVSTGKLPHPISNVNSAELTSIISKKAQYEFLRLYDKKLIIKETVIGGKDENNIDKKILVY
jgi:hypothetical protein